jgi:hypothetical protein
MQAAELDPRKRFCLEFFCWMYQLMELLLMSKFGRKSLRLLGNDMISRCALGVHVLDSS